MGVLHREQAPATEQAGRTGTVAGPIEASERAGEPVSGPVPRQYVIRVEPAI
jgi:hypothetical protein